MRSARGSLPSFLRNHLFQEQGHSHASIWDKCCGWRRMGCGHPRGLAIGVCGAGVGVLGQHSWAGLEGRGEGNTCW